MEEYNIEKNIPVPDFGYKGMRWPFAIMEVGDSVLIPLVERTAAGSSAKQHADKTDKQFTSRKVDNKYVRFWRVK